MMGQIAHPLRKVREFLALGAGGAYDDLLGTRNSPNRLYGGFCFTGRSGGAPPFSFMVLDRPPNPITSLENAVGVI
jgi:hypothetical protein